MIVILSLVGCLHDLENLDDNIESFNTEQAKKWIENNQPIELTFDLKSANNTKRILKKNWEYSL